MEKYYGAERAAIVRALTGDSEPNKVGMLEYVALMGESGASALRLGSTVATLLSHSEGVTVRAAACNALGQMGEEGAHYAGQVAEQITDLDPNVRLGAIHGLQAMGAKGLPYEKELKDRLQDENVGIIANAAMALGQLQAVGSIQALADCLKHENSSVILAALCAMGDLKSVASPYAAQVEEKLKHPDRQVRYYAVTYFAKQPEVVGKSAKAIAACLADGESIVRDAVVRIFEVGAGDSLADAAAGYLSAEETTSRCTAAGALSWLGERAAGHAGKIAEMLGDDASDDSTVMLTVAGVEPRQPAWMRRPQCASAFALSKIGAAGGPYAGRIAEGLAHADSEVRCSCVNALARMGPLAVGQVDKVKPLLNDADIFVASGAAHCLGELAKAGGGGVLIAEAVAEKLTHYHQGMRAASAKALAEMGEEGAHFCEAIARLFNDRCPAVREAAVCAMVQFGVRGQMYAACIARLLPRDQAERSVRIVAIQSLAAMGERGAAFAEEVAACTTDQDSLIRTAAVKALAKMPLDEFTLQGMHPVLQGLASNDKLEAIRELARSTAQQLSAAPAIAA